MRKYVFFMLVFLILPAGALGFELPSFDVGNLLVSKVVTNREPSVSLSRPVDTQVVNNPVVFKWRYFDPEDDELEYYILQIDDDPKFWSPTSYQGIGSEHKLVLEEEGEHYWRVLVVNKNGQKLSDSSSFYLNPEMKVCDDGTPYFECSSNKPKYCSGGRLDDDCFRCGCDDGGVCSIGGECLSQECIDGTLYGECSKNKPFFCLNGNLQEVCSICGCDGEETCLADGDCVENANWLFIRVYARAYRLRPMNNAKAAIARGLIGQILDGTISPDKAVEIFKNGTGGLTQT